MEALAEFARANLWLCLGAGVVLLIVADEVFGVSRAIFGEPPEERAARPARKAEPDPLAEPEAKAGPAVEDFLPPRR